MVGRVPAFHPSLLPAGLRAPAAAVAVLAAGVVGVLGVRYAGDTAPGRVDGHLDRAVEAVPGHWLTQAVVGFGSPLFVAAAATSLALLCLLGHRFRAAALAIAGPGITGLVTTVGKPVVDRTIGYDDGLAFPSGHTGGATSLALVVGLLLASALRLGTAATAALAGLCAVVGGGVVGTGMVVTGAHYPTDIIGGFATATAAVLAVALLLDAAGRRRAPAVT